MKTTERMAGLIESAPVIDLVADPVSGWVARLLSGGRVKDFLSGTWLGHPLHPMAVGVPIGALAGVSALDLVPAGDEAARRRLIGLGIVAAPPAAAAGAAGWSDTEGGARRVGAEGKIEGECVTCPWHGSRFALADGEVRRGPATRPQPIIRRTN